MRVVLASFVFALLGATCGNDQPGPSDGGGADTAAILPAWQGSNLPCVPGTQVKCFCNFQQGTQQCLQSGNEVGPCRCTQPGHGSDSSGSGGRSSESG